MKNRTLLFDRERLRTLRVRAGLSQRELGKRVEVSGVTICHWENGHRTPRNTNLTALCLVLKCSINALMNG